LITCYETLREVGIQNPGFKFQSYPVLYSVDH
jgi:hypothetical protein